MKIVADKSQRAMALMVVLIAIFVLSALVGAFAFYMKVETKLAMNAQQESYKDSWQGASDGVERAKWYLANGTPGCKYTSLNQRWAGGPGDECETNGPLADIPLNDPNDPFKLKITDLDAKINVNLLLTLPPQESQDILRRAMLLVGCAGGDIDTASSSILDWIDPNPDSRVMRPNGAKSDYYQSLDPPYVAKNGPIDDLSELLLVKGIREQPWIYSKDFRWVAFQQVDRHGRMMEPPTNTVYLDDLFTPLSSVAMNGLKVNLNTTSAEVLQVLGIDEPTAVDLIARRDEAPFIDIRDAAGRFPQLAQILNRYCVVRSQTFKVEVTVSNSTRKYTAVIGISNPKDVQLLSFYWEDPDAQNVPAVEQ